MGYVVIAVKIIQFALYLYMLVLLVRVVVDWFLFFSRDMRPKGIFLVFINIVYAITDPVVQVFSSRIPPLRLGMMAFDTGFLVLFLVIYLLQIVMGYIPVLLMR